MSTDTNDNDIETEVEAGGGWGRVAAELHACRELQNRAWGDLDDAMLGRYLAGEVNGAERQQIEEALQQLPELRKLTDLVSDVLREFQPESVPQAEPVAAPVAAPVFLPFPARSRPESSARKPSAVEAPRLRRRAPWGRVGPALRRRSSLVAAACLLLACGVLMPRGGLRLSSGPGDQGLALRNGTALRLGVPGRGEVGGVALEGLGGHPPVSPTLVSQLDQLNRSVEAAAQRNEGKDVWALAHAYQSVVRQAAEEQRPAGAAGNQGGPAPREIALPDEPGVDLERAEKALGKAHSICARALGPQHPTTVWMRRSQAGVYQLALNAAPDEGGPFAGAVPRWDQAYRTVASPYPPAAPEPPQAQPSPSEQERPGGALPVRHPHAAFAPPAGRGTRRLGGRPLSQAQARKSAHELRDRLTRLPPAEVKASVVPVLEQALREASRPEERVALALALGELGPASREAVPTLLACLHNASSPQEREAVLVALGRMGPAARAAAPALLTALHSDCPRARRCAADALVKLGPAARRTVQVALAREARPGAVPLFVRGHEGLAEAKAPEGSELALTRAVLKRLEGREGRIGVEDEAECFSARALLQSTQAINALASGPGVELHVETVAALSPADADARVRDRGRQLGPRGVYLLLSKDGQVVRAHVTGPLEREGLAAADLAGAARAHVLRKDHDGGLLEVVRRVVRFELRRGARK